MFTHYKTEGFILKKEDKGEADRLFTLYTKDFGKIQLLARAERKINSKLRARLELFYLSEVEFIQGKHYKTLTDVVLLDDFKGVRRDLAKLSIAQKISEALVGAVHGQEADLAIWDLLNETFRKLDDCQLTDLQFSRLFYFCFLWNFISILGYEIDPSGYDCFRGERLGEILRIFSKRDWDTLLKLKITDKDVKEIQNSLEDILEGVLAKLL